MGPIKIGEIRRKTKCCFYLFLFTKKSCSKLNLIFCLKPMLVRMKGDKYFYLLEREAFSVGKGKFVNQVPRTSLRIWRRNEASSVRYKNRLIWLDFCCLHSTHNNVISFGYWRTRKPLMACKLKVAINHTIEVHDHHSRQT